MLILYFWIIQNIDRMHPTHRDILTCRVCSRVMNVVWVDEIDVVMSPEFDSKGKIINFLGTFPDYRRGIGVSEQGYYNFQCVNKCPHRYADNWDSNDYFFDIISTLENINRYRTGKHNLSLNSNRQLNHGENQGKLF
jgi:hypothetical protein